MLFYSLFILRNFIIKECLLVKTKDQYIIFICNITIAHIALLLTLNCSATIGGGF